MNRIRYLASPAFINIYLTNECNLKCTHCIDGSGHISAEDKANEMTDDQIYSIIDFYLDKGVYSISFSGGEPLLHPSIHKFLSYIRGKSKTVETTVITNSTLLTPITIKKLEEEKVTFIRTSIESCNSEIHDAIRGQNNFDVVISKIKMLLDADIPKVGVSTTVSRLNINTLDDTIQYLSDLGVNNITLAPLMPVGRGKSLESEVLSPEEFRQLHIKKKEWEKAYQSITITMDSPLEALLFRELGYSIDSCGPCSIGTCFLGFKANGDIYACPMRDEVIIGNIFDDDLNNIWRDSNFLNKIRQASNMNTKCITCDVFDQCGGGCRAYTHIMTGDVIAPDPFCWKL